MAWVAPDGGPDIARLLATELAAAIADPLFIFDRDGVVRFANAAAVSAFGASRGMAVQLRFRAPEMHDLVDRILTARGGPDTIDYAERVPLERVFKVTATPIGNATGLFVLIFKDQSETRRIDRMRADFIANASHELRTPLASVAGFIETLRGPGRDDAGARERFLEIMQGQTERMARLIDDLLSLSRLEMKPFLRPDETVDLRSLVIGVADSMTHMADEADVVIERELPETPVEIHGNRDEIVQILENLIENACKYGASGGRVLVTLRREESDGEITLTVRDFGQGMAEEHIPRVTERFYRADVETSRSQKGTGLGLSIVKHILDRHDGWLSITSKLGQGSAFTAHFPLH